MTSPQTQAGRAQVNLLWMIMGILVLLAMGFLAWNSYQQIEKLEQGSKDAKGADIDGVEQLQTRNKALRDANLYLTATLHNASGILGSTATNGGLRTPGAGAVTAFCDDIVGRIGASGIDQDSTKVQALVSEIKSASDAVRAEHDARIRRYYEVPEEEEGDEGERDPAPEDQSTKDAFISTAALRTFSLDQSKLGTVFQGIQDPPTDYLTGLLRAIQIRYDELYDEHDNLEKELFRGDSSRMKARRDARSTFASDVAAIRDRTSELISTDAGTKFDDSIETIKNAAEAIESTRQEAVSDLSDVYSAIGGDDGWEAAFNNRNKAQKELKKFTRRQGIVKEHLSKIVEKPLADQNEVDGRVLQTSPLQDIVYIDLDAADHVDVGLVFEVYGLSTAARATNRTDGPRILRGEVEVIEVGKRDKMSKARIIRVVRADRPMERGDILINRDFNPKYMPKVALHGIFKGYMRREWLADRLREHNYEVQAKAGYDTDFIIRGDGGMPEEPTIDGIKVSDLGIRSVPMRRVLRMLALPLKGTQQGDG